MDIRFPGLPERNPGLELANAFGVNRCGNGKDKVRTPVQSDKRLQ